MGGGEGRDGGWVSQKIGKGGGLVSVNAIWFTLLYKVYISQPLFTYILPWYCGSFNFKRISVVM